MMNSKCRVGDMGAGKCPHHSSEQDYITTFTSGADHVFANESSICTVGSIGMSTCGHPTVATSASSSVFVDELGGTHRVGDIGANYGPYIAVSGSDNVFSED